MRRTFMLSLFVLALSFGLFAQGGTGAIEGRVLDPASAVIPGVTVTAINQETRVPFTAVTNEVGAYALLRLPPGTYSISVEHTGFKKLERTGVLVQVGDRLNLDLTLAVGSQAESVVVEAEAPLVRTADAQTGEVINNRMILDLPQLNRDPLALIQLSGNVHGDGRAEGGSELRINGGRTLGVEYFVDGVTVGTGMGHGVSKLTPTTEAVQEFKVITNGLSAEYGRLSGGAVELVSKSGTNQIHGQLFEYIQNRAFNANSWRNNKEGFGKDNFQQNQFGGAVGGPLVIPKLFNGKDKTFWHFNYEGFRYRQGGTPQYGSVPTEAMRKGDLSNVILNGQKLLLYDQDGPVQMIDGKPVRTQLLYGDGVHIPEANINPVAKATLKFVPLPNRAPDPGTTWVNNYVGFSNTRTNNDTWAARFDHAVNSNQRVFFRMGNLDNDRLPNTRWLGPGQRVERQQINDGRTLTTNYDWTISPTLLFTARAGVYHNPYTSGSQIDPSVMAGLPLDSITKSIVGSTGSVRIWAPNMNPFVDDSSTNVTNSTSYNANAAMVKTLGRHMLKFGYEHRRYYDNFTNGGSGFMLATGRTVRRIAEDAGWDDTDFVNSFGGFLQGYISHSGASGTRTRAMNFNYHGAYIQDDFKVSPNLTLNLGVRWDMETPVTERTDKLYFWDPDAPSPFTMKPGYNWAAEVTKAGGDPSKIATTGWAQAGAFPKGAVRIANSPEWKSRHATKYDWANISPRLGIAYAFTPTTTFRAYTGQTYLSSSGNEGAFASAGSSMALADSYGELWHVNDPNVPYYKMILTLDQPFLPQHLKTYQRDAFAANQQVTGGDPTIIVVNRNSHMPKEWSWNTNVQRQLAKDFVVEAGYSGLRGMDLLANDLVSRFPKSEFVPSKYAAYQYNIAVPTVERTNLGDTANASFLAYPYPYFGPVVLQGSNVGKSQYHAMTLRAERRMSRGMAFLVNYTLSRLYDNAGGPNSNQGSIAGSSSGTGAKDFQQVDTLQSVYGISPLDQRHVLKAYYQVELPFGKGRRFLGSTDTVGKKVLDFIVGGWEFAGLSTWASGKPIYLAPSNRNNKPARVETTFNRWASPDHNLSSSTYKGKDSVFHSLSTPADIRQSGPKRLDRSKIISPEDPSTPPWQLGDVIPTYGLVRQPSFVGHDMSFMKRFPLFSESRYIQFRAEAANVFNMRGWPQFVTDPRSSDFGLMIAENGFNQSPRKIQMSARIVF